MTTIFSPTFVMGIGILIIAAGIGLIFNHDYWYLFSIPLTIGGFILYFDFSMKHAVIKYYEEQMKPIDELKDKIIKEINDLSTESQSGKLEDEK